MATASTGWYAACSASLYSSTKTTATIRVYSYWQNNGWTYDINNVSSWVYAGSQSYQVKNAGSIDSTSSSSARVSCGYHDFTVNKTTAAQSIACYSKITSNSSYVSGTKTSSTVYVTVPAKDSYTIAYNANGGTGAPTEQTKWHGTALKISTTEPTRSGHKFQGWATSSTGGVVYAAGDNYTADASVTLYAVWKADTYTITYDVNEGTGGPTTQTKTYGVDLTISSEKPTRTNYNFLGWSASSTASTATYEAGSKYTANAPITLYAVWELAYIAPRITSVIVARSNASGNPSNDGTYIKAAFSWETDKEATSALIEWKASTSTTWSSKSVSLNGTAGDISEIVGNNSISTELAYSVRITVTDAVGNTSISKTISAMIFPIDFLYGGKGTAVGKPAELEDTFEVNWPVKFNSSLSAGESTLGDTTVNGSDVITKANFLDIMFPVGSMVIRYDHTSPAELFGGTWTRVIHSTGAGTFLYGSTAAAVIGECGGEAEVTLTVDQMPSHKHSLLRPRWFGIENGSDTSYSTYFSKNSIYGPGTTAVNAYKTIESYDSPSSVSNGIFKTGGGGSHNNIPPFIKVSIWRRTA